MKRKTLILVALILIAQIIFSCKIYAASNPYPYLNGYNCTYYAWQRAHDKVGVDLGSWGDAGDWANGARNAGYTVDYNATADSIVVWPRNNYYDQWGYYYGYGHVAYVEYVSGNTMHISESNWAGKSYNEVDLSVTEPRSYGARPQFIHLVNKFKPSGEIVNLGAIFRAQIVPKSATTFAISASGKTNGSNVSLQKRDTNSDSQWWQFTRYDDGTYTIVNISSNLSLDVYGSGNSNGENAQVWLGATGDKVRWYIYTYNGGYRLVPRSSSKDLLGLDVTDGSFVSGKNIEIYEAINNSNKAQTFNIEKYRPDGAIQNVGDDFIAQIVPKEANNFAIEASGKSNGSNVSLQKKNKTSDSQKWKFVRKSDGSYNIINVASNLSLDIYGSGNTDSENIQVWKGTSGDKVSWYIYKYNGGYRLVPKSSSKDLKALDVAGTFEVGHNLQLFDACSPTNSSQTFAFEKYISSFTLNTTSVTLNKGTTKTLTATITPSDAKNKILAWSSSNTSVATVSSSGIITAKGKGTAVITAKTTDGTNISKTCTVTVKEPLPFTDVSSSSWYYTAVEYAYKNKIMSGMNSTTFLPDSKLTRGQLVTILHNMEGSPYVSGKSKFSDVQNTNEYYYVAVKWASGNNIISGYSNGKFGPNDLITREQLAVILNNYCRYKGKYKTQNNILTTFKDSGKIASYAYYSMRWATGVGVLTGSNGNLNPQGTATRAEAASMIYKYCLNIK